MITPGIYKHYKGNNYEVLGTVTHSETLEKLVLYKALYEPYEMWVRPIEMFSEVVDKPEYNYKGARFQLIEEYDS